MYSLNFVKIKIKYLLVKLSVSKSSSLRTSCRLCYLLLYKFSGALVSLRLVTFVYGNLDILENVAILVVHFYISVGFVFNKHAGYFSSIGLRDTASSDSLVIEPIAVIGITVEVVVFTSRVAHVVLHVTFIEFSISEEDLDLAISNLPVFKATFDYFISRSEKPSVSIRSIFFPVTTVNTTVREFAKTSTFTLTSFEITLVNFSIRENHLTYSILLSFTHSTFKDMVSDIG
jgi:hypothetical protein